MINPLIPFTIKGALWYQGEGNVYRANFYSKLMKVMVDSWRSKWNQGSFRFIMFKSHHSDTMVLIMTLLHI